MAKKTKRTVKGKKFTIDWDKTEEGDDLFFIYDAKGHQIGNSIRNHGDAEEIIRQLNEGEIQPEDL